MAGTVATEMKSGYQPRSKEDTTLEETIKMTGNYVERRKDTRYPAGFRAAYWSRRKGTRREGLVLNMSSKGLLIASCTDRPPIGSEIEIALEWPASLDGIVPLKLCAKARVVRHSRDGFAAALSQYEFRTTRVPADKTKSSSQASGDLLEKKHALMAATPHHSL
jgi:hypothetical protein